MREASRRVEIPRILIVDDEESILFAMRDYLSGFSYHIDVAQNQSDALEQLSNNQYLALIIDLRLSDNKDSGGLEIVEYVRGRWSKSETRIIVFSAYGSPENQKNAFNLGVDIFLHKPTLLSEVVRILDSFREDTTPTQSPLLTCKEAQKE